MSNDTIEGLGFAAVFLLFIILALGLVDRLEGPVMDARDAVAASVEELREEKHFRAVCWGEIPNDPALEGRQTDHPDGSRSCSVIDRKTGRPLGSLYEPAR